MAKKNFFNAINMFLADDMIYQITGVRPGPSKQIVLYGCKKYNDKATHRVALSLIKEQNSQN